MAISRGSWASKPESLLGGISVIGRLEGGEELL